ncbi:MAG: TIGR02452 family protein [Eubacteriales bacterium]|nr:TIGR02452 family protein [Eubacteriales bacterium]
MGRREMNAKVFQDTTAFITGSERLTTAVERSRRNQKLIPEKDKIADCRLDYSEDAGIIVSGKRTLEAASAYADKKVCILNFASATNPGGGVVHGSSAQEESLCRCSILYYCLNTPEMMEGFYLPHRRADNPLYNDDLIYTPDVVVIKTDTSEPVRMRENDWYKVNVITCAAPNLRKRPSNRMNPNAGSKAARITGQDLRMLLESRIRKIFQVAAAEGNEVLILGAFGCGAFQNPPDLVADVFHDVTLQYRRKFETIEYAVFHTGRKTENYRAFQNAFREETLS